MEKLINETKQVLIAIEAITSAKFPLCGFGETNFSLAACEAAAEISGCDATLVKMLNKQFRDDAAALMFERAAA